MSLHSVPITVDGARNLLTYSRESTDRLVGVFGQDAEVREWAEASGYEIVGYHHDVGVKGTVPVDRRPGLSEAISRVERGEAAGIAVHRLDRLARSWDAQEDAVQRIWGAGGRLFSADHGEWKPDEPGTPEWCERRYLAEAGSYERDAILARTQNARRRKIAHGGYGGGSRFHRRYGVELVRLRGKLEYRPIPEEQDVIRRVCGLHASGAGYGTIARTLNDDGVSTVTGAPWRKKTVRDLVLRGPDGPSAAPEEIFDEVEVRNVIPIEWARKRRALA